MERRKKIAWDGYDVVDVKQPKSKSKPVVIDNTWIEPYWLLRDRAIYKTADEETKQAILKRYGKA